MQVAWVVGMFSGWGDGLADPPRGGFGRGQALCSVFVWNIAVISVVLGRQFQRPGRS
jgi:hypothetical protein